MCSQINEEYLYVIHHEMGHCQYYLAYNEMQPPLFQAGANHGFHEAIGDTIALSVINPTHLKKLGFIEENENERHTAKQLINFLMKQALQKLAFLPYALSVENWRWKVYSEKISTQNLNSAWWKERLKYQGIASPISRSEKDFDPGSKYHIANGVPYIRYFISYILQFQFYDAMCKYSGHVGPLSLCDFSGSKKAGRYLREMMQKGRSQNWTYVLYQMTKSNRMNAYPMKKYFKPLTKWLKSQNQKMNNKIGWD